jgi:hypothetical protein
MRAKSQSAKRPLRNPALRLSQGGHEIGRCSPERLEIANPAIQSTAS